MLPSGGLLRCTQAPVWSLLLLALGFIVSPATRQQEVNIWALVVESPLKNNEGGRKKDAEDYIFYLCHKPNLMFQLLSASVSPSAAYWFMGRPPLTWHPWHRPSEIAAAVYERTTPFHAGKSEASDMAGDVFKKRKVIIPLECVWPGVT